MKLQTIVIILRTSIISLFRNNVLKTLLMVILGSVTAFTLLILLADISKRDVTSPKSNGRDTVYVKLVDTLMHGSVVAKAGEKTGSQVVDTTGSASIDKTSALSFDNTLQQAPAAKAAVIGGFNQKQIAALNKVPIPVWKWLIVPSLLFITGIAIFLSYKRLPATNYKLNIDRDPEQLTALFERHVATIASLGNPRKIKRFSNKIRFQYHYLNNKHLLSTAKDLDNLLLTLLYIENNLQKMNLDLLSEADKQNPLKWFKTLIRPDNPDFIQDDLARHLLQLNKNVIA